MKKVLLLVLVLLVGMAIPGSIWAQKKKKKKDKSSLNDNVAMLKAMAGNNDDDVAMERFMEGMKFFILEEFDKALVKFQDAAKLSSDNAAIHYQLAQTLISLKRYDDALPSAKEAIALESNNRYYYTTLIDVYKSQRKYTEAISLYEEMTAKGLSTEEEYLDLANLYLTTDQSNKAIKTYEAVEAKYGFNERIIRQKQRIFFQDNNMGAAMAEGQKLVEAFPNVPEYIIEQAQLLLSNDQIEESKALLLEVLEDNPEQVRAKFLLSDIYNKQGEEEKAKAITKEALASPQLDFDAKIEVLADYLRRANDKEPREMGTQLAALVVQAHPKEAKAHAIYADFLMTFQDPLKAKEARDYYLESVKIDGDNFNAWQQIAGIDWELKDMKGMANHTSMALEYFPNQASLHLQNGVAHMMEKDNELAKDAFEQGKMLAIGNPNMQLQFNSYLADIYHRLEEHQKSDNTFEEILAYNPNDLHALNNYSYFLSLRKENLELAKEMGSKLVQLAPDNDTYLDTYGWVLYIAGDYKEAKKYLEKASNRTDSGTVLEHYGDVLYKLGDTAGAIEQWKKAQSFGNSDNPEQLEKKLAEGKLVE